VMPSSQQATHTGPCPVVPSPNASNLDACQGSACSSPWVCAEWRRVQNGHTWGAVLDRCSGPPRARGKYDAFVLDHREPAGNTTPSFWTTASPREIRRLRSGPPRARGKYDAFVLDHREPAGNTTPSSLVSARRLNEAPNLRPIVPRTREIRCFLVRTLPAPPAPG